MRVLVFAVLSLVVINSSAAGVTDRYQKFRVATIDRFLDRLVVIVPPGVDWAAARGIAERSMHAKAEQIQNDPRLSRAHSKMPLRFASEREYKARAEAWADRIIERLLQSTTGSQITGSVLADIADFYATLATFRGDLSNQLAAGIIVGAVLPSVALLGLSIPAIIQLANAQGYMYWDMDLVMTRLVIPIYTAELATMGVLHAAALGTAKGRHLVRSLFAKYERTSAAARIEHAFWSRLEERVLTQRELAEYAPVRGHDDFPIFFYTRLAYLRDLRGDCELWLGKGSLKSP